MAGRVLVYLRRLGDSAPRQARFSDCLLEALGSAETESAAVSCEMTADNRLLLESSSAGCQLTHPPFCPIFCSTQEDLARLPTEIQERGVDVGVVSILESSDGHVLLTRRARHMRTFPSTWVPPGGHIDPGETLMEAALRELKEETGLHLKNILDSSLLCMWESVYPYSLTLGPPSRHHLVLYFRIRVQESHTDLESSITLDPEEVEAAAWIDRQMAQVIASGVVPEGCPHLRIMVVNQESAASLAAEHFLPASVMAAEPPASGPDIERVSTGTRYAMRHWLKRILN